MYRKTAFLALIAGGFLSSTAIAADWASFDAAFAPFPCNDGWTACIVNGQRLGPDLQEGAEGILAPASLRLDWVSLKPRPGFSPFVKLSEYTGEEPAVAEVEEEPIEEEPVEEDYVPPPATGGGGGGSWSSGSAGSAGSDGGSRVRPTDGGSNTDGGSMVRPTDGGSNSDGGSMVRPTDGGSMVRPTDGGGADPMVRPSDPAPTDGGSMVRPTDGGGADPMVRPSDPAPTDGGSMVRPSTTEPAVADAVVDNSSGGGAADTCDNLTMLEPAAMMGKLTDGQVACLEASLAAAASQTDKDKLSRVLMANSWSKGDKKSWEKLVKRHLDQIDQSDPDICYKYALYLSKKGPGRANGVIRWADVALENRTRWVGDTYKSRVYNLYKLRSAAAQSLWQQAEGRHAASPTDESRAGVEKSRNQTKVYSREWYEYAREAGKDTTKALQLCISAAGTDGYCEGG